MEEFIIKELFNKHLSWDVKVFYQDPNSDDYTAYSIHIMRKGNNDLYSDDELKQFTPDFEIVKTDDNKWYYSVLVQTFYGDYWQPPEWELIDSDSKFNTVWGALEELIIKLVKESLEDTFMSYEMEKSYNEENNV